MKLSQEALPYLWEQALITIKRTIRYVEWQGVMALLGFLSLALASSSQGYPSYFVFTLSIIGLVLVWFAALNSYNNNSSALAAIIIIGLGCTGKHLKIILMNIAKTNLRLGTP